MKDYDPSVTEPKWQKKWAEAKAYDFDLMKVKNPYYCMVMFPYPSGARLHVGHWFQYSIPDSFSRYMKMKGKDVFHPLGFDAFGLPAENYAIKTGTPPAKSTATNVDVMIEQYKRMGTMFDWKYCLDTSTPEYYRWTQWLFLQMYKNKLAYKKLGNVNFCPKDQTVLANEQVWEGKCERCGTEVVQKPLDQWYWKITDYSQKLLDNLDQLDWPEKTKLMQRNWIGRSEGVNIHSRVKDLGIEFEVYDSVPQTFMAQTFTVIAPEHPMVKELVKGTKCEKDVLDFVEKVKRKKAVKKFTFQEDMEGIFTGRYVDNPFGTGDLPIWVASFVVMEYGTGVVHCSAHDERDFAFAKKYDIPLRPVMFPADSKEAEKVRKLEFCYAKDPDGIMEQPAKFKGRKWGEVRSDIITFMETEKKIAKRAIHYRLRDWLVSRQRYWGAPIPIVYDPEGNAHPVPQEHLPWMLPTDVEFKPTGKSPLTNSKEFIARTEKIFGKGWRPEFDTMDTFVCSSFYFLRYLMGSCHPEPAKDDTTGHGSQAHHDTVFVDPALEKKWLPVSMYIGGPEHACMHLIYARFVMMALKDFGYVSHEEPFQKLVHQGLITNKGAKMSKSKNNVVSPDSFVDYHGSDVFRMYLMFMGPFTEGGDWSDTGIRGIDRFVQRVWRKFGDPTSLPRELRGARESKEVTVALHRTIKKVTESLDTMHFNTAISAMMEFLNAVEGQSCSTETVKIFTRLISPLAPHLAEELWEAIHSDVTLSPTKGGIAAGFVLNQEWPSFDPKFLVTDSMIIVVQVNGKVRGQIEVAADADEKEIIRQAKAEEHVVKYLEGKKPKKEIYVKGRLVSLVV